MLRLQRQADLCEFKASLVYRISFKTVKVIQRSPGACWSAQPRLLLRCRSVRDPDSDTKVDGIRGTTTCGLHTQMDTYMCICELDKLETQPTHIADDVATMYYVALAGLELTM